MSRISPIRAGVLCAALIVFCSRAGLAQSMSDAIFSAPPLSTASDPATPLLDERSDARAQPAPQLPDSSEWPAVSTSPCAEPAAAGVAESSTAMFANWNNGLELKSKDGRFRIHAGGLAQYDINWLSPDAPLEVSPLVGGIGPNPNSTQMRRARIGFDGTFYEVFDFRAEFDMTNEVAAAAPTTGQPVASAPGLTDVWLQWSKIPHVGAIRVGNQREAMGLEHMQFPRDLSFLEASYLNDMLWGPFNGGYNPGVAILNATEDQRVTWEIGVWGNNSDPFGYSIGDDWALSARTTFLVFYDEPSKGRYLWEVGSSASVRKPDEDFVRLRDRGDIRSGPPGVLNPIYADTLPMLADEQDIVALETFAQWGPLSLQAEYAGTWVQNAVQPFAPPVAAVSRGTPYFQGGYVEAWYFLTGDNRTYIKAHAVPAFTAPLENAACARSSNGGKHGSGAWQVGVRYNAIDLDDNGINGGELNSFTFGVNWFLNPNAKLQFNYDFTNRSPVNAVAAGNINSFGTRFQFNF